jgi:Ca2+-binding RTX toxin-like protein
VAHLTGDDSANTLNGGSGKDVIYGLGGDDSLWGGLGGADRIFGGDGNDHISDGRGIDADTLVGGAGFDTLDMFYGTFFGGGIGAFEFTFVTGALMTTPGGSTARGFESVNITGSDGNDTITGGRFADVVRGWQGDDLLDGGTGDDFMIGDNGNDTLYGGKGNDTVTGNGGSDVLYGGEGDDFIRGGAIFDLFQGDDTISGGKGADEIWFGPRATTLLYDTSSTGVFVDLRLGVAYGGDAQGDTFTGSTFSSVRLVGSAHDDFLVGGSAIQAGAGDDRLQAYQGTSILSGGEGKDTFILGFDRGTIWDRPLITDFDQAAGELIDLHLIDSRARPGDQAFTFIGTGAFSGKPAEARYTIAGGQTVIELNVTADTTADHTIYLDGEHALTAADFVL